MLAQHSHHAHEIEQKQEQEKTQKYTCPMHPEVITDHPGNCPKCGMKLVPLAEHTRPTSNSDESQAGVQRSTPNHQSHMSHPSHKMHQHEMEMYSSVDLADPMTREGSGTSWLPDSSPMYGRMFMFDGDMLMLHGAIFPRYTNVSTRRGDDRIDAPNWIMAMYSHLLGDSAQFGARLMMSLDPLTETGRGYPLLFQSGESWHDQPLHDRQHPHDLFMELAADYRRALGDRVAFEVYGGPAGEPALGPTAFPHRLSAMPNPVAPVGHHWLDSTHISFGVVTGGIYGKKWKAEASAFNGRERTIGLCLGRWSCTLKRERSRP